EEGDRVVMATVVRDEATIFLASVSGHVIYFPIDQINILSGVGKGVIGIKLEEGDGCLGGAVISHRADKLEVETSKENRMEFHMGRETTTRGGKGFEAVKRSTFVRIIPPPIELVNWDEIEGKTEKEPKTNGNGKNGGQPMLFE